MFLKLFMGYIRQVKLTDDRYELFAWEPAFEGPLSSDQINGFKSKSNSKFQNVSTQCYVMHIFPIR